MTTEPTQLHIVLTHAEARDLVATIVAQLPTAEEERMARMRDSANRRMARLMPEAEGREMLAEYERSKGIESTVVELTVWATVVD
jgi:hypothetical protein